MPTTVPPGCPLSLREYEILAHLAAGRTRKQIAANLRISPSTVYTHLQHAYRKLDVSNGVQGVAAMFRNQWFGWKPPVRRESELPDALQAYAHAFDVYLKTGHPRAREAMRDALQVHRERPMRRAA